LPVAITGAPLLFDKNNGCGSELRAVSATLHTPNWGEPTLSQGAQNSVPYPLSPQRKFQSPKLKYEALEISEVMWPFEIKVLRCITVTLGPFASKVFTHYSWKGGPEANASLAFPLNTPLHITLTLILYENMKAIEHVVLHPICILSHLMCACNSTVM